MPPEARVGIVEDDERIQQILARFLQRDGHQVVLSATSLAEAQRIFADESRPELDVLLLDKNLGDGTGEELGKIAISAFAGATRIGISAGVTGLQNVDVNIPKHEFAKVRQAVTKAPKVTD